MSQHFASGPTKSTPSHGESMVAWALWGALLAAMFITYVRLDPVELYHVSGDGWTGGLSRVLVEMNFPIALVAIALVLIALDSLPSRAWLIGGPAILLCAFTVWPGVVDDGDLDARPVNFVPALGVLLALGLCVAAIVRSGAPTASRRPLDGIRLAIVVMVVLLSLPWIFADLGLFVPEWVFIMERPITGSDGKVAAAVHLGHHHGLDGALLAITAVLLSRVRLRSPGLARATRLYVSLLFAYGIVNFAQDLWHEQVVKRGWADWKVPNATHPSLTPIWLVMLTLAAGTALVLHRESLRVIDTDPAADHDSGAPISESAHR